MGGAYNQITWIGGAYNKITLIYVYSLLACNTGVGLLPKINCTSEQMILLYKKAKNVLEWKEFFRTQKFLSKLRNTFPSCFRFNIFMCVKDIYVATCLLSKCQHGLPTPTNSFYFLHFMMTLHKWLCQTLTSIHSKIEKIYKQQLLQPMTN